MAKKSEAKELNLNRPASEEKEELQVIVQREVEENKAVEENESALVSVPIETLPLNLALACSVYTKLGTRFVLFHKQGERLSSKSLMMLQRKGVGDLFIHKAFWKMFSDSLRDLKLPKVESESDKINQMRQIISAYGQELERKAKEPKKPMFDKLQKVAEDLAHKIFMDPSQGMKALRKSPDPIAYFVNHSLNVAIYACLMGVELGFTEDQLKTLAYGCFVHDVGNLYLPKALLYKREGYSKEEELLMQTHTKRGAEFLQSLGSPPAVVLIALQHHERMDGMGYPRGLSGEEIHPMARLCSIADAYDALTSARPYAKAMSGAEALAQMQAKEGKYDPDFLKKLVAK